MTMGVGSHPIWSAELIVTCYLTRKSEKPASESSHSFWSLFGIEALKAAAAPATHRAISHSWDAESTVSLSTSAAPLVERN